MKEKTNLWRLYSNATAYGKRPSDFFALETDFAKWVLDEACLMIGRRVENNINNNNPPFEGMLESPATKRGYKSVKNLAKKKAKIKPDGTW